MSQYARFWFFRWIPHSAWAFNMQKLPKCHVLAEIFPIFQLRYAAIGVAPITTLRTCIIKIETFKGGHLMW